MKRLILIIVGIILVLVGGVWLFQGIGVLPGSVMTGMTRWAVIGSIMIVVGVVALIAGNRAGHSPRAR